MDPAILVPIADAIPVHWVLLLVLLTITTFLHLVAMNVMLGTGFIAFTLPLTKGESVQPVVHSIAGTLVYSTALTINMGVAPLLFLQTLYGQFFYTSTVLMAVYWLSIVFLLIVTYYSLYIYKLNYGSNGNGSLFLGIPVVIMLLVLFLFINNISLMQMPESWLKYFEGSRGGFLLNMSDKTLLPRYLHFVLSALAVGGLAVATLYEFKKGRGEENTEHWISSGCNWFSTATIINFGIGFWFLGVLPESIVAPESALYKLFMFFIILSVVSIIPALIKAQSNRVYQAVGWTLLSVFLMTVAREVLRMSYLKQYFNPVDLPVTAQYSPFLVFLILSVAVIAMLTWMANKVRREMEVGK